jgi:membrane protein DedA with SNARE-associated domain
MQKHVRSWWRDYEYKHTTLAFGAMLLFILLLNTALAAVVLEWVRNVGYIGAFFAGMLSTSFFTTVPALALIIDLSNDLNPFLMALVGGVGAAFGDWLLIKFFEERIIYELKPLFKKMHAPEMVRRLDYKYTRWILLLTGAFILASPIPDEIGLALMGISNFKQRYIVLICFALNTIGIFVVIELARALMH